jgi:putative transcriptional regulator
MGHAFESIKQGLLEAIAHASGQRSTAIVHTPPSIDVQAIRKHIGMTQTEFAAAFGISVSTLRHWERGDRIPRGPARVLLRVVAQAPRAVLDALATAEPGGVALLPGTEALPNQQEPDGGHPHAAASPENRGQRRYSRQRRAVR